MFKVMEQVLSNATRMEKMIGVLKNELALLKGIYNDRRIDTLKKENSDLNTAINEAKKKLIALEISHGVKQIPIPTETTNTKCVTETPVSSVVLDVKDKPVETVTTKTAKKEKKKAPEKKTDPENELPVDVGRLDLRVGQIMQVDKHPDADSLYVSKIMCGDPALRTVVSGLVKFVPIDELKDRKVVVLCNLKPAKMRGVLSEAMVMCASTPENVEVLSPPATGEPGDLIECAGFVRQPDAQLNPKKKIFEAVAPDLKTNDSLQATYKGTILTVAGKGAVTAKSLKNVNIK